MTQTVAQTHAPPLCSAALLARVSTSEYPTLPSTFLRQALEQAGDHAGARGAFERALTLCADPDPMGLPPPTCPPVPAAPASPAIAAELSWQNLDPGPHDGTPGDLSADEVATAVGGLARAALRLGDIGLGLRAAAAAADPALSLECAGILERQNLLEVGL